MTRTMFLFYWRYKLLKKTNPDISLFKMAEQFHVKSAQEEGFKEEIQNLKNNQPVDRKKSKLKKLTPFLDSKGVMRCHSRVATLKQLCHDAKFPMFLPKEHPFTNRVVERVHDQQKHLCGASRMVGALKAKFWIPSVKGVVKTFIGNCVPCKRAKPVAAHQMHGQVDAFRGQLPIIAFAHTAMDFFGHIPVKMGRGKARAKRYVLLATCAMSRAVHLEVCESLDTDAFLNGFYRFTCRRGVPKWVRTDNGRNFTGGNNEIQLALKLIDWTKVEFDTGERGVENWDFSKPMSPHNNGLAETMVKLAKNAMEYAFLSEDITDYELFTVVIAAEALLNSRPLKYVNDDPDDTDGYLLTPNHLLMGQAGGQFAPYVPEYIQKAPKARWIHLQNLVHNFYSKWIEYLIPELHSRPKWRHERENIAVGQVVVMLEKKAPRGLWPLAIVEEVVKSTDGRVRNATVRCGTNTYLRNITKLCPTTLFEEVNISQTFSEKTF